jgi:flagellar basal body rod protein FlgB
MIARLIGSGTAAAELKKGLTASSQSVRGIAHRVANAGTPDFADALNAADAAGRGNQVDLEAEMVALADEQLRFEATSNLLQKVYQQVRSAIRER